MALKENYKDDILDTSQNVKRKYQMENNGDGTVSFTDVTEYTQQGDSFGSGDINATNSKVNTLDANLDGFKFYPTGTELVALVADDSFYKDANDKYVLADSPTGQVLLEDTTTYKALASTEETHGEVGADTCSPFSKSKKIDISINNSIYDWYVGSSGEVANIDTISISEGIEKLVIGCVQYTNGSCSDISVSGNIILSSNTVTTASYDSGKYKYKNILVTTNGNGGTINIVRTGGFAKNYMTLSTIMPYLT